MIKKQEYLMAVAGMAVVVFILEYAAVLVAKEEWERTMGKVVTLFLTFGAENTRKYYE